MNNLWEIYAEIMEYDDDQIAALQTDGYVFAVRESAKLTGYYIKNEFDYEGENYLLMQHNIETNEDSVF